MIWTNHTHPTALREARNRRIRRLANLGLLIVVGLLLSRCMYYDYGVPADHPAVRYPSPYADDDGSHQFYTTLHRIDEPAGGSIAIEVQHLAREPNHKRFESRITVRYTGPSRRLRVRPSSVRLEHRTRSGKLLKPSDARSELGSCAARTTPACMETFSQLYRPPRSRRLQERIRLEYELEGRPHTLDVSFPLEYRYHYSWWDVMQGV